MLFDVKAADIVIAAYANTGFLTVCVEHLLLKYKEILCIATDKNARGHMILTSSNDGARKECACLRYLVSDSVKRLLRAHLMIDIRMMGFYDKMRAKSARSSHPPSLQFP